MFWVVFRQLFDIDSDIINTFNNTVLFKKPFKYVQMYTVHILYSINIKPFLCQYSCSSANMGGNLENKAEIIQIRVFMLTEWKCFT